MGFRQGDPLWATKHLGDSPYTMATSGCLVTATADTLRRDHWNCTPGTLCDYANADGGFQKGTGYFVFDIVRRFTGGKYTLVEGLQQTRITSLIEVLWTFKNGTSTKHWLEHLNLPNPFGIIGEYVLDPNDGKGKSLNQPFWKPTGRRLSIIKH